MKATKNKQTGKLSIKVKKPKAGVSDTKAQYDDLLNRKIKAQQEHNQMSDEEKFSNTAKSMRLKSDITEAEIGMSRIRDGK